MLTDVVSQPKPAIKSFLLADSVFQQNNGKWCVIGVFERILTRNFPALHPNFGVFLSLSNAEGTYDVGIEICDSEDRRIAELRGLKLNEVVSRLDDVRFGFHLGLLPLPRPGTYFVRVYFNGVRADGDVRFTAAKLEAKP